MQSKLRGMFPLGEIDQSHPVNNILIILKHAVITISNRSSLQYQQPGRGFEPHSGSYNPFAQTAGGIDGTSLSCPAGDKEVLRLPDLPRRPPPTASAAGGEGGATHSASIPAGIAGAAEEQALGVHGCIQKTNQL